MKKTISVLLALSCSMFADNIGVKKLNYTLSTNANHWSGSHISSDNYILYGNIHIPIYQYLSGGVYGGVGRSDAEYDYSIGYSSNNKYYYGGFDMSVRDSDIGRIGVSYTRVQNNSELNFQGNTFKDNYYSDTYALYGDYFYDDITVTGAISHFAVDGNKQDGTPYSIGAMWYIQDNTRLGVQYSDISGNGYNDNEYSISIAHQPYFFSNAISLIATYTKDEYSRMYGLALNYHFNTRVSLKKRDREY